MTAQSALGTTLHPSGTKPVLNTIIPITKMIEMTSESQNLLRIFGTSRKKFDFSTSFFVAPQVMLYENKCAKRAWERWTERPPKKKKLFKKIMFTLIPTRDFQKGQSTPGETQKLTRTESK